MTDFWTVFEAAHKAAADAIDAEVAREPENMHAFDCGFAWVVVNNGLHPFVRWCRKMAKHPMLTDTQRAMFGDRSYPRGWQFWKPGNFAGQSVRIHRVGALAFAAVLNAAGIPAVARERLD